MNDPATTSSRRWWRPVYDADENNNKTSP